MPISIEIGGLAGVIVAIIVYLIKGSFDMGRLSFQVNQMWDLIWKDAQIQLLQKGVGKMSSPFFIVSEGYEKMKPLLPEYFPVYKKVKSRFNGLQPSEFERKLFSAFQMEKAQSIMKNVCVPNNLLFGAGVMLVIQACKEGEERGEF